MKNHQSLLLFLDFFQSGLGQLGLLLFRFNFLKSLRTFLISGFDFLYLPLDLKNLALVFALETILLIVKTLQLLPERPLHLFEELILVHRLRLLLILHCH